MIYGSFLNVEIHLYEITNKIEGPVQIVEQVLLQMYVSSYLIVAAKSSSHIVKYAFNLRMILSRISVSFSLSIGSG